MPRVCANKFKVSFKRPQKLIDFMVFEIQSRVLKYIGERFEISRALLQSERE